VIGMIKVEKVEEHEDGSATVVFECDDEAKQALINEGLISMIEKAVDKHNDEYNYMTTEEEKQDAG